MKAIYDLNGEAGPRTTPEVRLKARAVSRGISIGRIVCLHGTTRQFYRIHLEASQVPREIRRLRAAVAKAKRQLTSLAKRKTGRIAESGPGIFDAHKTLIEDSSLQAKIEAAITNDLVNAEWAIKTVADGYVAKYKAIPDEQLRDRYIDIEDVAERILVALGGGLSIKLPFAKNSIIAARELRPSTLVEIAEDAPRGVITENGGWTSHTFILAREMNWPAVTGVKKVLRRVKTGDKAIIDGFNGVVILHPTDETLKQYSRTADQLHEAQAANPLDGPSSTTLDGREIRLFANSDTPAAFRKAKQAGAIGVGLFRSEFLFNRHHGYPGEAEQAAAYRAIAEAAGDGRAKIRTFDLGVDQMVDQNAAREKNPALGLRAIRLGLGTKRPLRTQIRALLRASHKTAIDIVIPMVSGVSEILAVKELIAHESEALRGRKTPIGKPRVGAMVEVPSAVLMIEEIVAETDFVCLGTNDLIQYLLAADRDNESVAGWYRTLHPAVLKALKKVLSTSAMAGKPAIVCGEMAGSPYYAPVLIGLGATDLSMNLHSIPRIQRMISGIAAEEAVQLLIKLEKCRTVEEIEETVGTHARKKWAHLFPPGFSFSA